MDIKRLYLSPSAEPGIFIRMGTDQTEASFFVEGYRHSEKYWYIVWQLPSEAGDADIPIPESISFRCDKRVKEIVEAVLSS